MATITGTAGNDNLIATTLDPGDFILGLGGNDTITGGPGLDTLSGNEGNDLIRSRGKGDLFLAGQGEDTLIGESDTAQEALYGNKGADLIISSPLGGNVAYGGQGNDTIYSLGNDFANGDLGDDIIFSNGFSTLFGGGAASTPGVFDGNDTLVAGIGNQVLVGNTGNDVILFQPAVRRSVFGKDVVEGGFGGVDIVRNLSPGNVISINGLVRGDVVEVVSASNNPNTSDGLFINLNGSAAGQVMIVEGFSLNQLISTSANFLSVNNILVNSANLVPNASGDILRFTV